MSELPRYILGVDPGKKTGVALLDLLLETCIGWELVDPDYGFKMEELISEYRPAVVGENFIINAATVKNTQAPWSLEQLGIAKFLAAKYGCHFEKQAQSSAKRFSTNERLHALGWYTPGRGHLADAQRQVLLYITKHGWWHDALSEIG
jgi:hypothetical protein